MATIEYGAPEMLQKIQVFVATGLGSGFFPRAPGTAGTLVAAVLFIPLAPMAEGSPWLFLATLVGLLAIGVWCSNAADRVFDSHDNPQIVIDEFLGYFAALVFVPYNWKTALGALVVFRLFDIFKIPPARWIDRRLGGGWGVMLDDLVAGIYTNLVLQLLIRVLPGFTR